ncbi:MAG: Amuc_1100 family pilus-like protein [Victivallales bacterium]|nr:Amuc_1100 family pilus-like protein [Victivallales bacterium]
MDFLKKNWGFLLVALIFLIGLGVLFVMISAANTQLKTQTDQARQSSDYLSGLKKKNMLLSQENIDIAERNAENAKKEINALRSDLRKRYRIKYSVPDTATAVRRLREEINGFRTILQSKDVDLMQGCENFTFDRIVNSTTPPPEQDLDAIFKNLAILSQVIKTLANSEVYSLDAIARPLGLIPKEDNGINLYPIEVTISAPPENAQRFINAMSDGSSNLFFLRSLEIIAPDEVNGASSSDTSYTSYSTGGNILADPFASLFGNADGINGGIPEGEDNIAQNTPIDDMGMGGGNNADIKLSRRAIRELRRSRKKNPNAMNVIPRRRRRDAEDMPTPRRGRFGRNALDTETQTADGEQLVEVPVKRQEYLAFSPKVTTWKLRFDFIEFNLTDEEKAAEAAEQSN